MYRNKEKRRTNRWMGKEMREELGVGGGGWGVTEEERSGVMDDRLSKRNFHSLISSIDLALS